MKNSVRLAFALLLSLGCGNAAPTASPPAAGTSSSPATGGTASTAPTTPTAGKVVTLDKFGIKGSLAEEVEMDADHYGELKSKSDHFDVAVDTPSTLAYETLAETQKYVASSLSAKNIKSEALADGWLLTFDSTNAFDPTEKRFQVIARRTIGGKVYSCSGNEPTAPLRANAVAFCRSLTVK